MRQGVSELLMSGAHGAARAPFFLHQPGQDAAL
jgi:hypothetical protein